MITIPVYQSTRWGGGSTKLNSVIMIKLTRLAEVILCQIKSMNSDDMITDLLICS